MGLYIVFRKNDKVEVSNKMPKAYDCIWIHGQDPKELLSIAGISLPSKIISAKPPYHYSTNETFVVHFRFALFIDHRVFPHTLSVVLYRDVIALSWSSLPQNVIEHIGEELKNRNFEGIYLVLYLIIRELMNSTRAALGYTEHQLDKIDEELMKRRRIDTKRLIVLKRIAKFSKISLLDVSTFVFEAGEISPPIKEYEGEIKSLLSEIEHIDDRLLTTFSLMYTITADQLNSIMMKLTAISAIFLPLTLIASIYGMNFRYMPELAHPLSYPLVLAAMTVLALSLFVYFKRKRWI